MSGGGFKPTTVSRVNKYSEERIVWRIFTSWWCAGWGGGGRSRAAPQPQPGPPGPAGRTPTLAAGTTAEGQKAARNTEKGEDQPLPAHTRVLALTFGLSLSHLPDRTALEGTGPSRLASGCPYCFAGCWAACLRGSGSWNPGWPPQPAGLEQHRKPERCDC